MNVELVDVDIVDKLYNYFDYRMKNVSDNTYQIILYTNEEYLCWEIRAEKPLNYSYHIKAENEFFSKENWIVYRNWEIYRETIDKKTWNIVNKELIIKNHAKVCYNTDNLKIIDKN